MPRAVTQRPAKDIGLAEDGWSFDSPDIPRFIGGPAPEADFEEACRWAEDAVRLYLDGEAEERGASTDEDARVVHLVATPAAA